jgi:adenosylcobyric acid synthase
MKTIPEQTNDAIGGIRNLEGTVYGTYIHGIFDNMAFTNGLINNIRIKKGLIANQKQTQSFKSFKEAQYDKLADILRECLDMELLYRIAGLK